MWTVVQKTGGFAGLGLLNYAKPRGAVFLASPSIDYGQLTTDRGEKWPAMLFYGICAEIAATIIGQVEGAADIGIHRYGGSK